jgi:hypothetical protein
MAIPELAPGATGDMVKALQHALIANGYSVGPTGADGKFGDHTRLSKRSKTTPRRKCSRSATRPAGPRSTPGKRSSGDPPRAPAGRAVFVMVPAEPRTPMRHFSGHPLRGWP